MKNALVAGLIAGIIGGIVALITGIIAPIIGLWESIVEITSTMLAYQALVHIGNNAVWGIIFGVIYRVFYDKVPGKGTTKGLYFGLLIWLLVAVRPATFLGLYGQMAWTMGFIVVGFFFAIVFGLVLGAIYKK